MRLKTVLFVSESLLGRGAESDQLEALVAGSRDRNARLGIAAALVSARGQFAQLLEGPGDAVQALMERIGRDSRHRNLRIVLEREQDARELTPAPMELVYSGDSFYVARQIASLLMSDPAWPGRPARAEKLRYLIRELAQPGAG
jgi:hypothetical protein